MNLSQAFNDACSRFTGANFHSLSLRDQVLVTIYGLEAEVNNGGFDQYYFNGAGNQAWFAPTALDNVGAHRMASIVQRANAMFGTAGPPSDPEMRQTALFRLTDESPGAWDQLDREFYTYPDDIAELLVAHFGLASSA